jgi:hypothetical protein
MERYKKGRRMEMEMEERKEKERERFCTVWKLMESRDIAGGPNSPPGVHVT